MSDKQHFENPPVEEIDHPTSRERSEAPNNGSKPKHTSSITTNNSGKKKPSSHHPHQQVQKKQESEDTPVTADPQPAFRRRRQSGTIKITAATSNDEEASKPAPQVKPEKAVTASRHGSTTRKTKRENDQAPQELQESISKSPQQADSQHTKQISLPDSIEPIADTPAVEPEPQALPGKIETVAVPDETAQEVISPDVVPDNTSPSTKVDSPSVDVEPNASTRRVPGKALVWILMAVLIGSSFLLWRDLNDTYLYLYALDPASGQTVAQQNLGGGYQGDTAITNPVQVTSSLVFGVQTGQPASASKQQVFSLTGNDTSWKVASQFAVPLQHGTLILAPGKRLLVVHANGLEVMTTGGQRLWHIRGDEPTLGTHPFQPAFFGATLYSVKSASKGVVASYDLQSGAVRWTQKLDDTMHYAAPFLLYDNMLYIAGDHNIYALNRADGTLLWKATRPARTLLMFTDTQPLLLVAGPQGLAALNAFSGAVAWSYNGLPRNSKASTYETLVPAQFYQASIAITNHVIYATGIVWDAQQVREQLWLFAVDAATGNVRWTEQIGSDVISADAGRIYAPSVDTTHGLVMLQQAQHSDQRIIAAYDTASGAKRWSVQLDGVTTSAPGTLQVFNNALLLLNTQSDRATALHNLSPLRMLLIALTGLSALWLLLLLILPFKLWKKKLHTTLHTIRRFLVYPLKLIPGLWRQSHAGFALALLAIVVLGGVLLYGQLVNPRYYLNRVATSNGSMQWQNGTNTPVQLAMADRQGSIVIRSAGTFLHQVTSFSPGGASQWTSFASEGMFSLPAVSAQPGTVLVALSGHTSSQYRFAPDDPAYAHPLDSLYALYLLDRQTGQIIWQNVIISPQGQQNSTVLASDAKFFYVASRATNPLQPGIGPVVQLVAVDKTSGTVVWRIFGPSVPGMVPMNYGSLLLDGRSIIWQVSNTIYTLDTMLGQIQWRKYIPEPLPQTSIRDEEQMAEAAGVILVARSDGYHALDLATGNERWTIASSGNGTAKMPRGVAAVNDKFLVYGAGTLQAIDPADQHSIWSHKQPEDIQSLKISDDGTLIYAILTPIQPGNPTTQVLAAIDMKTGTTHWTFQPFEQERFVNAQSDGFQYTNNTLYATICSTAHQTSCDHEVLYAINAATGEKKWDFKANSIYNVQVSVSSGIVAFQTNNSLWGNMIEYFKG
jgi:outer membrane protein assembly factor BamB